MIKKKYNKAVGITMVLLLMQFSLFAVKNNDSKDLIFRDGDRVVFIGNSITHGGLYHLYIQTYYQTRFPNRNIEFYNCGVGGDVTSSVLLRMDYDILPHKPTVAVIKLGMNDAGSSFYERKHTEVELLVEQNRIVEKFKIEMREIIRKLKDNCNPRLFLIKPTPYDANCKKTNGAAMIGKNETIQKLTLAVEALARETGATVMDFYNPLNELNIQQQKVDSNFTAIGKDRVHPGPMGHLLMTYLFLKTQQVPEIISKVEINVGSKMKSKAFNAVVKGLTKDNNTISFRVTEKSLPFPFSKEAEIALKYMPITDLNQQLLVVKRLKKGSYYLKIGTEEIGIFTSESLNLGVNLASIDKTPQNKQAQAVLAVLTQAFQKGVKLRDLVSAKILLSKANIELNPEEKFKTFVELKRKENSYYGRILDDYQNNYNKLDTIEKAKESKLDQARKMSQPVTNVYLLTKE